MKRNHKISLLIVLIPWLGSFNRVWAQDNKGTDPITAPAQVKLSEEIEVVRPYKPVLANAVKIRRNPDLNDIKPFKTVLNYTILNKKLELNTDIRQLQYQQLTAEKAPALQNNHLKAGFGNFNTGSGELYLNGGRDEALQTGFFIKHFNQKGSINKQQFSQQELGIFGKSIGSKYTLSGDVGYKRLGTYFYGSDPVALINTNPHKQQLNLIQLSGELAKQFENPSNDWVYALRADAYLFKNHFSGKENSVRLSALGSKTSGAFNFGMNAALDFTNVKDPAYSLGNHIIKTNPYAKYHGEGFVLNVGLNIGQELGMNSRTSALPAMSIEAPIISGYAAFFGGISGDVIKTSLNELTFENPYLGQNIEIRNSIEKSNIYAGIKGSLGIGFGFKALAYFKKTDRLPLFVNNSTNLSHFAVIYDAGISTISGIRAEIDIKASDVFNLSAKLITANYKLASESKAWFKPAIRLETQADAQINKKLSLNAALVFNGETYGRNGSGQAVSIKSFMDLSAGASYQLSNKWGVFLQANNLFGTAYQQYLYYPRLGLNAFGGIHYSF